MPLKSQQGPETIDNTGALEKDTVLLTQNRPFGADAILKKNAMEPSRLAYPSPSSQLCIFCQNLLTIWSNHMDEKSFLVRIQHCASWDALKESAAKGCRFCAQFSILQKISTPSLNLHQAGKPRLNALALLGNHRDFLTWDIHLHIYEPHMETRFGLRLIESISSREEHWYHAIFGSNTISAVPLCQSWLADCIKSHAHSRTFVRRRCPTRLIHLGSSEIRLCYSSEIEGIPDYATLSHCWGSAEFLSLNHRNIEAFRQKINLEDLTKTFQDAIYIAQRLGFRYIWIDSLCIIQNDLEDWKRESTLMASVYGGSTVNLAAASAKDGSVGCFFNRSPFVKCQLPVRSGNSERLYDCLPLNFDSTLRNTVLSSRGWVVQERLLSHRTLHFTDTEVFWECDDMISCERFPNGIPEATLCDDTVGLKWGWPLSKEYWPALIADYSHKVLTRKTDKLAAISGLARQLHNQTQDEYLAGLWRHRLEYYICWRAVQPAQRIEPRIAPTWSWASLDGNIEPAGVRFKNMMTTGVLIAHVDEVKMAHNDLGPFGPYSFGKLTLRCRHILRGRFHISGQQTNRIHSSLQVEGFQTLVLKISCDVLTAMIDLPASVYVVPITTIQFPDGRKIILCLLLTRVFGYRGRYERIGHVRLDDGDESYRMCLRKSSTTKLDIQEEDYTRTCFENDGSKTWVIEIV